MECILMIFLPVFTGGLVFFSYRQGLKDGRCIKEGRAFKPVITPKLATQAEKSPEDKIMDFVEKYEG